VLPINASRPATKGSAETLKRYIAETMTAIWKYFQSTLLTINFETSEISIEGNRNAMSDEFGVRTPAI